MNKVQQALLDIHDGKNVNGRLAFKALNQGMVKRLRSGGMELTDSGKALIGATLDARKAEQQKAAKEALAALKRKGANGARKA